MTVWRVPGGLDVVLKLWSIRETDSGVRHFVGYDVVNAEGRVSTPIMQFDPMTGTGVTSTGSRYQLVGRAGHNRDAEYVWELATKAWDIGSWTDITPTLVPDWRRGFTLPSSVEDDADIGGG
ncbi:hypothetical protein [Paraburkholderia azotifigens]|uniref:hypothetical protein n=1 Tax=Paraburkholderia azotifigens TaxID=2057004 RepID=UPI001878AF7C|nr:hypothetical protein [Paraburkholderia azotifigens]